MISLSELLLYTILISTTYLASGTAHNTVLTVAHLMCLYTVSGIWLVSHGVEYLGISIVLIYVGAISVLFLFVIMLVNIRRVPRKTIPTAVLPVLALLVIYLVASVVDPALSQYVSVSASHVVRRAAEGPVSPYNQVEVLSFALYSSRFHGYGLISVALCLCLSITSGISLSIKSSEHNAGQDSLKRQRVSLQVLSSITGVSRVSQQN